MLNKGASLQFGHGLAQLFLRVHHDWAVPCNWFLNRLAGDQQESNSLITRLHNDLVAPVEQYQGVIPDVIDRSRIGLIDALRQNRARVRRAAERARAGEYIGKGIARCLHFEPLLTAWSNGNVEIIGISRDTL